MSFDGFGKMLHENGAFRMVLPAHSTPTFKGKVYVLIDGFTGSACEPSVDRLKKTLEYVLNKLMKVLTLGTLKTQFGVFSVPSVKKTVFSVFPVSKKQCSQCPQCRKKTVFPVSKKNVHH